MGLIVGDETKGMEEFVLVEGLRVGDSLKLLGFEVEGACVIIELFDSSCETGLLAGEDIVGRGVCVAFEGLFASCEVGLICGDATSGFGFEGNGASVFAFDEFWASIDEGEGVAFEGSSVLCEVGLI